MFFKIFLNLNNVSDLPPLVAPESKLDNALIIWFFYLVLMDNLQNVTTERDTRVSFDGNFLHKGQPVLQVQHFSLQLISLHIDQAQLTSDVLKRKPF